MNEAQDDLHPAFAKRFRKLLDATPLLRSGEGAEEFGQARLFAAQDVGDSWSVLARLERLMSGQDIIPGEEEFDGLGGLELAPFVSGVLDMNSERLKFFDLMGKIVQPFCNLVKRGDLILEVARSREISR